MKLKPRGRGGPLALSGLASQADQSILGNVSGGAASPSALTATQVATFLSAVKITAAAGTAASPSFVVTGVDGPGGIFGDVDTWFGISVSGGQALKVALSGMRIPRDSEFGWSSGALPAAPDLIIARDAAQVLAQRNGVNAQTFRIYGTTTGSKYLSLKHDGTTAFAENIAGTGQLAFGAAALATTATAGYICLPSCAGTPTGVPASIPSGTIPMVVDTTAKKLWFYIGGAWTRGQVAAVDTIWA